MALDIPASAAEIESRAKTDIKRELPGSNPFLKNSVLNALTTSYSNRQYDYYIQLLEAITQSFPDTATGEYLEQWGTIFGIDRLPASQSSGNVIATGTLTSIVPLGTVVSSSDGLLYTSTASATIATTVNNIVSINRTGATATVITEDNHNLTAGVQPIIAGANETEYNGAQDIIITGDKSFTYTVTGSPATPATGTITATYGTAIVPVLSDNFGANQNQESGAELTLQSPLVGVDNSLIVDFGEIGGGTDQETDSALRVRLLERIQNPVANFNVSQITDKALEVAGVTRVFVQEITPAIGQVTIYFMRDNDDDAIPSASEVATVKNNILTIKPATSSDDDVIVLAPTPNNVNFTFNSITPSTATMQTAITNNLSQFFDERTEVGVNIDEDAYRSAIISTVDTETGDRLQTFDLAAPSGDIVIASGEIGVLGTVDF